MLIAKVFLLLVLVASVAAIATGTVNIQNLFATTEEESEAEPEETESEAEPEEDTRNGNGENGNSDTNGNDHTNEGQGNSFNVAENGNEGEGGFGDTQRNREGSHNDDQATSPEGANGGEACDPTIPEEETGGDGCVTSNCFGKVVSHEAQEHKDPESGEERLGAHSRDPLSPDDDGDPTPQDNETPRRGIGNQDQGHPSSHGAFNSQFDDDDAENVEENCN